MSFGDLLGPCGTGKPGGSTVLKLDALARVSSCVRTHRPRLPAAVAGEGGHSACAQARRGESPHLAGRDLLGAHLAKPPSPRSSSLSGVRLDYEEWSRFSSAELLLHPSKGSAGGSARPAERPPAAAPRRTLLLAALAQYTRKHECVVKGRGGSPAGEGGRES